MGKFKPFKAKSFAPPTKTSSDSDGEAKNKIPVNKDLEVYEVMYTKHLHQKVKSWEEGWFTYNLKNFKACLFSDTQMTDCIDTKYMRIKPDFADDEEFRANKFLVQIVSKKLDAEEQAAIDEKKAWEAAKTASTEAESPPKIGKRKNLQRNKFNAPKNKEEEDSDDPSPYKQTRVENEGQMGYNPFAEMAR